MIFTKVKEEKMSSRTGSGKIFTSKCVSVDVYILSSRNLSNNYGTKTSKHRAKQVERIKVIAEDWRGEKGKRYMAKQNLKGSSIQKGKCYL